MKALWLVVLAACGRINFDPLALGDDTPPSDSAASDGPADDATPPDDAPQLTSSCTNPIVPQVGVPIDGTTCSGLNQINTCSPGLEEHVFEFTAPISGMYRFSVPNNFEVGTTNANCTQSNICAGALTMGMSTGQQIKLVVERALSGCGPFTFLVEQL